MSASPISSRVALKAFISSSGRPLINPTVSVINISLVDGSLILLVVGLSVEKSLFCTLTLSFVSLLNSVDFPTLV